MKCDLFVVGENTKWFLNPFPPLDHQFYPSPLTMKRFKTTLTIVAALLNQAKHLSSETNFLVLLFPNTNNYIRETQVMVTICSFIKLFAI
jgi:hypothetical protein